MGRVCAEGEGCVWRGGACGGGGRGRIEKCQATCIMYIRRGGGGGMYAYGGLVVGAHVDIIVMGAGGHACMPLCAPKPCTPIPTWFMLARGCNSTGSVSREATLPRRSPGTLNM